MEVWKTRCTISKSDNPELSTTASNSTAKTRKAICGFCGLSWRSPEYSIRLVATVSADGRNCVRATTARQQTGEGRHLSCEEEAQVQQQMRENFPDELGIDSALWTRQAVGSLIEQVSGVVMPIRTVGEYLKRWGFTSQNR